MRVCHRLNSGEKGVYVVHAGNQIHPNSKMAQLLLRERLASVEMLEADVQHKRAETQRMLLEEVLSLEREEHLIKDVQMRMWLRANLIHCLQDASLKRRLLDDAAEDDSWVPDEDRKSKRAKASHA